HFAGLGWRAAVRAVSRVVAPAANGMAGSIPLRRKKAFLQPILRRVRSRLDPGRSRTQPGFPPSGDGTAVGQARPIPWAEFAPDGPSCGELLWECRRWG